jgi:hypothetical protein
MPSRFEIDMARADGIITEYFGEPVKFMPRAAIPRRGQAADVVRETVVVTGVFTLVGDAVPLEGSRRGADGRGTTEFAVGDAKLWLSKENVAALGYRPKKGDAVLFTGRSVDDRWAVERADPSDVGDVTLHIVRERDAVEFG